MFYTQSFMVSGLIHKSLIYLKLSFLHGVRQGFDIYLFVCLHVGVQFYPHHLLKTILSPLWILGTLFKDQLTIHAWIYFCELYWTVPGSTHL